LKPCRHLRSFGEDTQKRIQATHNNALDNIGREDSFVW